MSADSDEQVVRYLLGDLPDDETERLDERSITDGAFAERLRAAENDLVDRYARGQPLGAPLERFERACRASPYLGEKVQFASAWHAFTQEPRLGRAPGRNDAAPTRRAWLGLAAAAALLVAGAGYLGVRNAQLRDEVGTLETRRAAIEQLNAELQRDVDRARQTTPAPASSLVTATFLLSAPRRGLSTDMTTVSIPRGTGQVSLRLQVESDEYATFWAAVRDPVTTRHVWRSRDLAAEASGGDRIVTFTVPVETLLSQRYSVELFAVTAGGSAELVVQYPVRVVLD
jgi:hypothetical protein